MARVQGLLWMFFISGLQAVTQNYEEEYDLEVGQNLTVSCPFNIQKYADSRKAWQKLETGQEPLTLLVTEVSMGKPRKVQMGRCELEDVPHEAMLHVHLVHVQVEDSGLYRCIIYQPPREPVVLFHPVRLRVGHVPSTFHKSSTQYPTPTYMFSPTTTKALSTPSTSPGAVDPPSPSSVTVASTPNPGLHLKDVTRVTRISTFGIVILVACGLLSKSLVFTALLAITQRSFSP